jgi:uncharacterized repeat protein (TIGR03803 family)
MPPQPASRVRSAHTISVFLIAVFFIVSAAFPAWASAPGQVLYSFGNGSGDGQSPYAGLAVDSNGNLYGTTTLGGSGGCGTVFELSPKGSSWTESVLYSFKSTGDGCEPYAGVVLDASGNLYGTTYAGGGYGQGIAYELSPSAQGAWSERLLYAFHAGEGSSPVAGVILDASGNLYGTTVAGGAGGCTDGCGTVFKLTPTTKGLWRETLLHTFQANTDGMWPYSALIFDSAGNLYGTTFGGGAYAAGSVYELKPSGSAWNESILYSFEPNGSDGTSPSAALLLDSSGNLYGTTVAGGIYSGGTAFKLLPASTGWTERILHSFGASGDGSTPYAPLVMNSAGKLRGTTSGGGANGNYGTLFSLEYLGSAWDEFPSYSFDDNGSSGYGPYFGALLLINGSYYGTTPYGGTHCGAVGCGTVYMVTP